MQEMNLIPLSAPDHPAISKVIYTAAQAPGLQHSPRHCAQRSCVSDQQPPEHSPPEAGKNIASAGENPVACLNRGEGISAKSDKFMWIFTSCATCEKSQRANRHIWFLPTHKPTLEKPKELEFLPTLD